MKISNEELETLLQNKVAEERKITVEIIQLLEEVSRRRIYLERGYGSLIEYCIKKLGYSESAAYRRIAAMRVAKEIPQVTEAISDGRLNLANVAQAHTFFRKEEKQRKEKGTEIYSVPEKMEILQNLERKTTREAEKVLLELSPNTLPDEKVRLLDAKHTQVNLVLDEELMTKLQEIRDLISHKNPHPSYAELITIMAELSLEKLRSKRMASLKTQSNTGAGVAAQEALTSDVAAREDLACNIVQQKNPASRVAVRENLASDLASQESSASGVSTRENLSSKVGSQKKIACCIANQLGTAPKSETMAEAKRSRYIPAAVRRRVWLRSLGQCCYRDPLSGQKCSSKFQLQIEHRHPWAKGGDHRIENLEILCSAHNHLRAVQQFGERNWASLEN